MLHLLTGSNPLVRGGRMPVRGSPDVGALADSAVLACRAAIRLTPECEHRIVVIGGSDAQRRLERLGVMTRDRISPPLGRPALAREGLTRLLAMRQKFDVIQPWQPSLTAAIDPVTMRAAAPPSRDLVMRLLSSPDSRSAGEGRSQRRAQLRALAGEPPGGGGMAIVLFGADPLDDGESAWLFRIIGMVDKSGERFVLVIPRGVRGIHRATVLHRDAMITSRFVVTEASAIEWLDAADIALLPRGAKAASYPLAALATARGVHVIEPSSDMDLPDAGGDTLNPACETEFARTATALRRALRKWEATAVASESAPPAGVNGGLGAELMERWARLANDQRVNRIPV